ncbi:hypothetical protein GCM10022212_34850 [Actimicrobium antarcticum]|uniref:Heme oxygenase n=1 Tax=Actimicrobium antarcticum TaxID=1051899 RepID=A0ABP7TXL8_9BURK
MLDHHPLLSSLLAPQANLNQYGDALAALHGMYAQTEAAILGYLQHCPDLFDYLPRRKLPALEADLHVLKRMPYAITTPCPAIDSVGALFGMLYTVEGATLGGQFIARKLGTVLGDGFPRQFYTIYGDHGQSQWQAFLHCADTRCPPEQHAAAATAAVALFSTFKAHLDTCQRPIESSVPG